MDNDRPRRLKSDASSSGTRRPSDDASSSGARRPSDDASSTDARRLAGTALAEALRASRARTRALGLSLTDAQWHGVPQAPGLNPPAWELAHLAWFAEFWVLRGPHRVDADGFVHAARPARHAGPDALLDSSRLAHERRWQVELPPREAVAAMLDAQLDACVQAIPDSDDDAALYFHRLALLHEDMHAEALLMLRDTLGYATSDAPALAPLPAPRAPLVVRGGETRIGWPSDEPGFAFDNERPAYRARLDDFEIDAQPLANAAFLRFVEAGGYDEPAFWPGEAGRWRASAGRDHPERWRRNPDDATATGADGWQQRRFGIWLPLAPDEPVVHINAWEAEAWCRWAGRRLPSAAEWEHAALSLGAAFRWGRGVWEWTADTFAPYPGFEPGPYRDYSQPSFGTPQRELRGGSFAASPRIHHPRYRNFYARERSDLFAGLRTAALRQLPD